MKYISIYIDRLIIMASTTMDKNIADIASAINDMIVDAISSADNMDSLLQDWASAENQARMIDMITKNMPKSRRKSSNPKPKDPKAPKKNRTAYQFYAKQVREEVKAEMEDATGAEVATEIGRRWKELKESKSPTERKKLAKLEREADKDKARYEEEMKSYVPSPEMQRKLDAWKASGGRVRTKKDGKPTKPKDPNAPKKPQSAYLLFIRDNKDRVKADHPDKKATERMVILADEWKALKARAEKGDRTAKKTIDRLQAEFEEAKAEYKELLEDYEPSDEYKERLEEYENALTLWKRDHPSESKGGSGRGPSAYILFSKARKAEMAEDPEFEEDSKSELTQKANKEWREHKEKKDAIFQKYTKMAKALKEGAEEEEKSPKPKRVMRRKKATIDLEAEREIEQELTNRSEDSEDEPERKSKPKAKSKVMSKVMSKRKPKVVSKEEIDDELARLQAELAEAEELTDGATDNIFNDE